MLFEISSNFLWKKYFYVDVDNKLLISQKSRLQVLLLGLGPGDKCQNETN